jgi:hypothetical protein
MAGLRHGRLEIISSSCEAGTSTVPRSTPAIQVTQVLQLIFRATVVP